MTLATPSARISSGSESARGSGRLVTNAAALASVHGALDEIRGGRAVIILDASAPDHGGYLMMAAQQVTDRAVAFLVRHTSGVVCVPLAARDCDRLGLPQMLRHNESAVGAAFTVSVDATTGVTTGISAADRARTIRLLADPAATAQDFSRPGHVFPLRAAAGGVLTRPRYTEAATDLTGLAGAGSAAVIAAIVNDDSKPVTNHDVTVFAAQHHLRTVEIADLVSYRRATENL